jgi:cell wall-associated NlpC family hydrolase
MKQIYTSVLFMALLCAWTTSQAFDNCEERYRQLQAQYFADKQAVLLKLEQVNTKTNAWFIEAKRNAPSVRAMYRMRTKHDEALEAMNKGYQNEIARIEQRYQAELKLWEQECNVPKPPTEKIIVDVTIEPAERGDTQKKSPSPRKPSSKKKEKKHKKVMKEAPSKAPVEAPKETRKEVKRRKKRAEAAHEAKINSLLGEAEKHLKTRYVYGGNTPRQGFDCSGFVKYVYKKHGVNLPRVSRDQAKQGKKVKRKDAAPGDLVYFGARKGKITHIGIVISEPGESLKMIHASSSKGVEIAEIEGVKYWEKRLQGFRRVIEP